MDTRREKDMQSQKKWENLLENLAIVILAFYPLRHISWGLDLWDTGYNYANFQYMGTEHMDPMWLFSTYLTNVLGNLLTKLPRADTLMGMNLYTGLSASLLALMGYFFCTRKLKMPKGIVFAGEMVALSLCWCPTATFYNYLTYVFFLISSILLYMGLTMQEEHSIKEKAYLIGAGFFLGANVLVRFSNLPQMGMILAVWAYDFMCTFGYRTQNQKANVEKARKREAKSENSQSKEGFWKRTVRHTLCCLAGYMAALVVLLGYIQIRYGIREYLAGIGRLFAMTDNATDYKPKAMIMGILYRYFEELYWIIRMGVIVAGGMILFAIAGWLETRLSPGGMSRGAGREKGTAAQEKPEQKRRRAMAARYIHIGVRAVWIAVSMAVIAWLYIRGFTSFLYYSYDPIWHPGAVFLMLAMAIGVVNIFHKRTPKEEKLISGMVILIILLTSIGSNNNVFPSMNNLFVAAPYTLWESWRFLRYAGELRLEGGWVLSSFPAKGILVAFLTLCFIQFGAFGVCFSFAEGTGIQNPVANVDNNAVLQNIKMDPQRAEWMTQLSAYVKEEGLEGEEVILYGDIPAISYYLQMPSAFNPWSDLDSYNVETMNQDLRHLRGEIQEKGKDKPVIILEKTYGLYLMQCLESQEKEELDTDPKWKLLLEFMEAFGYEQTFQNEKFAVYR